MQTETPATGTNTSSRAHPGATEKPFDAASKLKDKSPSSEPSTADRPDGNEDGASSGTQGTDTHLHAEAESQRGERKIPRGAHAAANTLRHTADYIREHDISSIMADAKRLVKENPGLALLGAALLGFVLARKWPRH